MDIGIVGAGKVGCSIGRYLIEQGISVAGYCSKTRESVDFAATFTETTAFYSLKELVAKSEILFLTTPDDVIGEVWRSIAKEPIQNKIICHFSGSLSSTVFSNRRETGVFACSVHPMYAFSSKTTSYKQLNQAIFTLEGDPQALNAIKPVFEKAGNKVCIIDPAKKGRYHAAASMVSNMMIGLYEMGLTMLADCGFSLEDAKGLMAPLVRGNIDTLLATSPEEALTGPIERGDTATVAGHLTLLTESERDVYIRLGQVLLKIAGRKNPDREYHAVEELLEKVPERTTKQNGGKK